MLKIIKNDGQPDKGMAFRIADGYEPRRVDTRRRLGLSDRCPSCHQRTPRTVPAWVDEAVNNLIVLREQKEGKNG